jgi:hypothetical protein
MKMKTLMNYMMVKESGKSIFYARDFGFTGGDILGLHHNGLIEPTGKEIKFIVKVDDKLEVPSSAKEWKLCDEKTFDFYQMYDVLVELRAIEKRYSYLITLLSKKEGFEKEMKRQRVNKEYPWKGFTFSLEDYLG